MRGPTPACLKLWVVQRKSVGVLLQDPGRPDQNASPQDHRVDHHEWCLFFRDTAPFDLLRHKLIPELIDQRTRAGMKPVPNSDLERRLFDWPGSIQYRDRPQGTARGPRQIRHSHFGHRYLQQNRRPGKLRRIYPAGTGARVTPGCAASTLHGFRREARDSGRDPCLGHVCRCRK